MLTYYKLYKKGLHMKKNFILGSILSLLLIGCGSSDSNSNDTNIINKIKSYDELAIIYNATRYFCEHNDILDATKVSSEVTNYAVFVGEDAYDCADFGRDENTCDTFTAEDNPGNITCYITANLR